MGLTVSLFARPTLLASASPMYLLLRATAVFIDVSPDIGSGLGRQGTTQRGLMFVGSWHSIAAASPHSGHPVAALDFVDVENAGFARAMFRLIGGPDERPGHHHFQG